MSGHFFVFMDKLVRCNVSGQFYSVHVVILKILNGNLTVGGFLNTHFYRKVKECFMLIIATQRVPYSHNEW